jgi:hypothetical protein
MYSITNKKIFITFNNTQVNKLNLNVTNSFFFIFYFYFGFIEYSTQLNRIQRVLALRIF